MRFRSFPVLGTLAAFFIALIVVGWLYYQPEPPLTADEENIAELVFKHAIEDGTDCTVIYLSRGGGGDLPDALMERFAGYGQRVEKGSRSGIYQVWGYTVSVKPEEARCKLLLRFAPGRPANSGKALVFLVTYTPQGFQSSCSYTLERGGDGWMITGVKVEVIV